MGKVNAWNALMGAKKALHRDRQHRLAALRPTVAEEAQELFEVEQLIEYFEKEDIETVTKF